VRDGDVLLVSPPRNHRRPSSDALGFKLAVLRPASTAVQLIVPADVSVSRRRVVRR